MADHDDTDTDTESDLGSESGLESEFGSDAEAEDAKDVKTSAGEDGGKEEEVIVEVPPHLATYPYMGGLAVQSPATTYIRRTDPLVLVLDASTSNRKLDLAVLGEALTRLLTYLCKVGRRVSILVFHSEAIVLHPSEDRIFPIMNCVLECAAPLRVSEHMAAEISELHTALNQPIKESNIEFLVKAYVNVVRSGAAGVVHHTWITSTLRLAAAVLRHVATRTEHGQVLLMCDGGEFYGRDKAGKQGFLEGGALVRRLVPAYGTLPCTVSVSCLAVGPDAELDTLGSIAYAFDGLLTYARGAKEVGAALADAVRFLARRPTQLLVTEAEGEGGDRHEHANWFDPGTVEARIAYARARVQQLLGASTTATWMGAVPDGMTHLTRGTVTQFSGATEAALMESASTDEKAPSSLIKTLPLQDFALDAARRLFPLMSWRPKVVAAADTSALTVSLQRILQTAALMGLPRAPLASLKALVELRLAAVENASEGSRAKAREAARTAFVRMLHVSRPFLSLLEVAPQHVPLLEALPVDSNVLEARDDFEKEHPRWVAARPDRAARYVCHLLGDTLELPGIPCMREDAGGELLWAPFRSAASAAYTAAVKANGQEPGQGEQEAITLGPTLTFADSAGALVGLQAHEVVASGAWHTEDIVETEDAYCVGGESIAKDKSRRAREVAAAMKACEQGYRPQALLPLFLQLEDAMNPYTSMAASKALATLVRGTDDAWADALLPTRTYGGLIGRWLHAACIGTTEANTEASILPSMQLVADVARALAITGETHLVSDMYARFVKGRPSKDELARIKTDLAEAEEALVSLEGEEGEEETRAEALAGAEEAKATLALYESGAAWRGTEVTGHLPALGAILALYRNPQEFARAKQAAIKEYVDSALAEQKVEAERTVEAEVERRLQSSLAARAHRGLAPVGAKKKGTFRKILRRALLAEGSKEETEGAKLDATEAKMAKAKAILEVMPPDISVDAQLNLDKYKLHDFCSEVVPVLQAEAARRGETPAYIEALGAKLTALHGLGDALVATVPADNALLAKLSAVFVPVVPIVPVVSAVLTA